jgi:cytochrome c-type biogenesis protein CcmE
MNHSSSAEPASPAVKADRPPNTKFIVGGTIVVLAIAALIVWALTRQGATPFYLKTSELVTQGPPAVAEEYRVNGNVVPGSVERAGLSTTFSITDGETDLTVTTDQPLPDAFRDDARTEVVAQGTYNGRLFSASQVLAKCPSKFKAKA